MEQQQQNIQKKKFNTSSEECNWFIVGNKFLIDAGSGIKSITDLDKSKMTVLLTHSHFDHSGGARDFEKVFIHVDELERVQNGTDDDHILELFAFKKGYKIQKIPQAKPFFGKEKLVIDDNVVLEIVHTPGHTPGSCCFYVQKWNCLFTGDTLYNNKPVVNLQTSNLEQYKTSMEILKLLIQNHNGNLTVYGGHYLPMNKSQAITRINQNIGVSPLMCQICSNVSKTMCPCCLSSLCSKRCQRKFH